MTLMNQRNEPDLDQLRTLAWRIRRSVVQMGRNAQGGYVGQGLEIAEIASALFGGFLNLRPQEPDWPQRDRFILSPAHYGIGIYAAMGATGWFTQEQLDHYAQDGALLEMVTSERVPGIENTGGSLGQGLSIAAGRALGAKLKKQTHRIVALLSDGEMQEGQLWEAVHAASHHQLSNLIAILSVNGLQVDGPTQQIIEIKNLTQRWESCGWRVFFINGNDINAVVKALTHADRESDAPSIILAETVLGFGVPLIEGRADRHYVRVENDVWDQLAQQVDTHTPR